MVTYFIMHNNVSTTIHVTRASAYILANLHVGIIWKCKLNTPPSPTPPLSHNAHEPATSREGCPRLTLKLCVAGPSHLKLAHTMAHHNGPPQRPRAPGGPAWVSRVAGGGNPTRDQMRGGRGRLWTGEGACPSRAGTSTFP